MSIALQRAIKIRFQALLRVVEDDADGVAHA
jgi:hypothetical protein